ncbi:two-component regulator propeller domain-containing protein [Nibrella saemangeumensis]|uniref:histidine kinase n=1 Tax=Nibrella saemangeumensis TaxID=1084526 RepID=A0ABP8MQ55_9BACT
MQDHRGFIWAATQDGLCRYDGHTVKVYRHVPGDSTSLPFSNIGMLVEDAHQQLWVKSETTQLAVKDNATGRFRSVDIPRLNQLFSTPTNINCLHPDLDGGMWLGMASHGLQYISPDRTYLTSFHRPSPNALPADTVWGIWQDKDRTLWVGTEKGLFRRRSDQGSFQPVPLPGNTSPIVFRVSRRPDGRLVAGLKQRVVVLSRQGMAEWDITLPEKPIIHNQRARRVTQIAHDQHGYTYIYGNNQLYRFRDQPVLEEINWEPKGTLPNESDRFKLVSSLLLDRSEGLWLGTIGYGLVYINLREPQFQPGPYQVNFHTDLLTSYFGLKPEQIPARLQSTSAYQIRYLTQSDGSMWLSNPSFLYHYRPQTRTFEEISLPPIPNPPPNADNLGSFSLASDPQETLWGVQDNYLFSYQPDIRKWQLLPIEPSPTVRMYLSVDAQTCWAPTWGSGLWAYDRRTGQTRWYRHSDSPTSLPSDKLLMVVQDPKRSDYLWLSTTESGMCHFNKRTGRCTRYSTQNGLPNDVVYCIIPDEAGFLWLSTKKGICRFDPASGKVITFYAEDGLQGDEFNRYHGVRMPDGTIFMGGVDGITRFLPRLIQKQDHYQPTVALTELWINNQVAEPNQENSPLQHLINETDQLTLPHNQNFLSLGFAAMQYNDPSATRYRYQLVNYNTEWVPAGEARTAVFTGLPPGEYTFRVNATNTLGVWSSHIKTLRITIRPPLWATWWAYLGYVLLAGAGLYGFITYRLKQTRLQQEALFQRREAEQLRRLNDIKTRFFSNITHEFRTPLTLIQAPTEQLLNEIREPQQVRNLETIQRNAHQLQRLINQMLDLAKLEADAMTVTLSRGDLGLFLTSLVEPFQPKAQQKSIRLTADMEPTVNESWFDREKLEMIVFNLLANALKFTPAHGEVHLQARRADGQLMLTVHDTGIGIRPEQLPHIFDRFYQGDDSSTRLYRGTGIGLALVKELVDLLKGEVQVSSEIGKGTTFSVRLPLLSQPAAAVISPSENQSLPIRQKPDLAPGSAVTENSKTATLAEGPMILLAEDNTELADFIENLLRQVDYRVWRADNGQDALQIAQTNIPDLIVSDVMMPQMDGFELCEHLKQDERTNHIGVLLLTARSAPDSRLTGLRHGADDYITKPFGAEELLLRIQNRLTYQQRLRDHIRQTLTADVIPARLDDPFLQRIYDLLGRHLDDASFGVDTLAEELNMSRMTLNRKLKAVSNLLPNELIRNYRLQRGAELLRSGTSIAEAAYAVGFESPQYFSTCFKELYDCTPSSYVVQQSERPSK